MKIMLSFILFMIPIALCGINMLVLTKYNSDKKNDELFVVLYVLTTLVCCLSLAKIIFHVVTKSI